MQVASSSGGPKVIAVAASAAISVAVTAQCRNAPVGPKPAGGPTRVMSRHIRLSTIRCARRAAASHRRCPSSDDLRPIRHFEKEALAHQGLEFRRPAADAASDGLQ